MVNIWKAFYGAVHTLVLKIPFSVSWWMYSGTSISGQEEVDPDTICQFTGFYDHDGTRIFEGDILEYTDFRGDHTRKSSVHDGTIRGWRGVIEWDSHHGWYLNKDNEHNKSMLKAKESEKFNRQAPFIYYNDYILRTKPKVIGNIHDKASKQSI